MMKFTVVEFENDLIINYFHSSASRNTGLAAS